MTSPLDRPARPGTAGSTPTSRRIDPAAGSYGTEPARREPARRDRRSPMGWLPWALLAGIAALLLLVALVANAVDDDGAAGPADDSLGQVGSGQAEDPAAGTGTDTGAGAGATGSQGAPGTGSAGGQGASGAGSLTAGGQDLLLLGREGRLGEVAGQSISGTATVESVVSDEGFWVGTGPQDRVFVFLTPQARQTAGESGFQVQAGQTVALAGAVAPLTDDPAVAEGVEDAEGRSQLEAQGHYLRADGVELG